MSILKMLISGLKFSKQTNGLSVGPLQAPAGEKPVKRNAEIFYLHKEGRKKLEENLLNKPVFNDIVSEKKIAGLLDAYYKNPNAENSYALSMLHTLALFINKVF